jgi:hypothetical protein
MAIIPLAAILAFVVFLGIYVVMTAGVKSKGRWFGLAAIICSMPVAFLVGQLFGELDTDACYANVIDEIVAASKHGTESAALADRIEALPLRGYETNCKEVEAAVNRWNVLRSNNSLQTDRER